MHNTLPACTQAYNVMPEVDTFCGETSVGEAHDSQTSWFQHPVHLLEDLLHGRSMALVTTPDGPSQTVYIKTRFREELDTHMQQAIDSRGRGNAASGGSAHCGDS